MNQGTPTKKSGTSSQQTSPNNQATPPKKSSSSQPNSPTNQGSPSNHQRPAQQGTTHGSFTNTNRGGHPSYLGPGHLNWEWNSKSARNGSNALPPKPKSPPPPKEDLDEYVGIEARNSWTDKNGQHSGNLPPRTAAGGRRERLSDDPEMIEKPEDFAGKDGDYFDDFDPDQGHEANQGTGVNPGMGVGSAGYEVEVEKPKPKSCFGKK